MLAQPLVLLLKVPRPASQPGEFGQQRGRVAPRRQRRRIEVMHRHPGGSSLACGAFYHAGTIKVAHGSSRRVVRYIEAV